MKSWIAAISAFQKIKTGRVGVEFDKRPEDFIKVNTPIFANQTRNEEDFADWWFPSSSSLYNFLCFQPSFLLFFPPPPPLSVSIIAYEESFQGLNNGNNNPFLIAMENCDWLGIPLLPWARAGDDLIFKIWSWCLCVFEVISGSAHVWWFFPDCSIKKRTRSICFPVFVVQPLFARQMILRRRFAWFAINSSAAAMSHHLSLIQPNPNIVLILCSAS